jgi:hypothetical protein
MARASPIQNNFNAGEFSPRLYGRTDISKYGSGCKLLEGFIPLIQGPALRRGGTRFVAEVKNSADRTWLVRFEFNTTQAYVIEFGDLYMRFYANHGRVVATGVAAYAGSGPYGELRSSAGIIYYAIRSTVGVPPPSAANWYPLTGDIYEIPSPYTVAELTDADGNFNLRFEESADVIYFAHTNHPPYKLSRLGPTKWVMQTLNRDPTNNLPLSGGGHAYGGPFQEENITTTTVYSDVATGAVTLTASNPIFTADMVNSIFQLRQKDNLNILAWEAGTAVLLNDIRTSDGKNYRALNAGTTGGDRPVHTLGAKYDGNAGVQWEYQDAGFGTVLINGFTSATVVTGIVVSSFPTSPAILPTNVVGAPNATTRWSLGAWSDEAGWPSQVAFFKERLCFARGNKVWLSVTGDYEVFTAKDQSNLVTADMAITTTLQSAKVNNVQWMRALSTNVDALVCGTAGSEFIVKANTENEGFGATNYTNTQISTLGSSNAMPAQVGNVLLFIQRAGFKLRDVEYDFASDSYRSADQSVLAEHLPKLGVTQLCYQQEPYSLIWATRPDGLLMCMTYSREQYPEAPHGGWHRQPIGGGGVVESLADIPAPDKSRNEVWMITRRTINGVTKRYVEWLEWERRSNDDPEDSFYVDSGLTLDNTQAVTLTPGAGATIDGTTNVVFNAGGAVFAGGDVGRQIQYRYFTTDDEGVRTYSTGKATITTFNSNVQVLATIDQAFPNLSLIPSGGWRLTVTTITGLAHLEGQAVEVLVNGATHPQRTVTAGAISLQAPASKVHVGLRYLSRLQTLRMNAGSQDGTSQGKKTRIPNAVIRLDETLGLKYGKDFTTMFDVDFRSALNLMDNPPPIFSGDITVDWPGDYDTTPWLCFEQPYPLPATLVAIMPQVIVADKG